MAECLIQEETLTSIADAIREKNGTSDTYTPAQMAAAISAIETSSALAFFVVGGTTQPSSPVENTIWVSTETSVTRWRFGESMPNDLTEGEVFFQIALSGDISVSAISTVGISVYLLGCSQLENGNKETKTAMIYQEGAWVQFEDASVLVLFSGGEQNTGITGGWVQRGDAINGESIGEIIVGTSLRVIAVSFDGDYPIFVYASTANLVDISDYSKLVFSVSDFDCDYSGQLGLIGFAPQDFGWYMTDGGEFKAEKILNSSVEDGTIFEIDISELSGQYYIFVEAVVTGENSFAFNVDQICLVP